MSINVRDAEEGQKSFEISVFPMEDPVIRDEPR